MKMSETDQATILNYAYDLLERGISKPRPHWVMVPSNREWKSLYEVPDHCRYQRYPQIEEGMTIYAVGFGGVLKFDDYNGDESA
jgi:hypothetical protein